MKTFLFSMVALCLANQASFADEISENLLVKTTASGVQVIQVFDPTDGGTFEVPANDKGLLDAVQKHIARKQTTGKAVSQVVSRSSVHEGALGGNTHSLSVPMPVIATCPNGRCSTPPVIYPNYGQQVQPTVRYLTVPQSNCPNGRCPNQR